jgi:TetR/AcrR family transcriptional repressor of nem operon
MNQDSCNVRQHILETAKPILLGKGFSAVGLSEILAAAAVPKGSFYHYFKSKDAFGEALLEYYFENYITRLDTLFAEDGHSAADRLMRYWQGWCNSQGCTDGDGRCLVVKLGGEVCDLSEAMRQALERGTRAVITRLTDCIEQGRADGSLAGVGDARQMAESLYQMWLGATLLAKIRRDETALDRALLATRRMLALS